MDIQLFICSPQTGNIFRSIDSLVLRHPIMCKEFNVQSFHSVQQFLVKFSVQSLLICVLRFGLPNGIHKIGHR
jgi:hypothetical protein